MRQTIISLFRVLIYLVGGVLLSRTRQNIVSRTLGGRFDPGWSADRKMHRFDAARRATCERYGAAFPYLPCISDESTGHPRRLGGAVLRAYVRGCVNRRERESARETETEGSRWRAYRSPTDRNCLRWVAANTATLVSDIIAPRSFHPRAPRAFAIDRPFAIHRP